MTKAEALSTLGNVLQNYIYGLSLSHFSDEAADALAGVVARFPGPQGDSLRVNVNDLGQALKDANQRQVIADEFDASLKRMLVREAYEVVIWYGEESNQLSVIQATQWYQFARIIRHAVSHKQAGIITQWPDRLTKKGISAVHWRGRTLDKSMVGHAIPLTHGEAVQLFQDMYKHIRDNLT